MFDNSNGDSAEFNRGYQTALNDIHHPDTRKNNGVHEESLHEHEWTIYFKNGSTITNIPTSKSVRSSGYFLAFDIDEAEDDEQKI